MDKLNSTYNQHDGSDDEAKLGEMSIDNSLIEQESPPPQITYRRGTSNSDVQSLRDDFQSFQAYIIARLEALFTKQEDMITKFTKELDDIKSSISFMNMHFEELKQKTENITTRVTVLENQSDTCNKDSSKIAALEAKIDDMEQHARVCNAEIHNLPEKRGENLTSIFQNIANVINHPLNKLDIISIHRVPAASNNARPKNIIVKFSNRVLRDDFISAFRLKKGVTSEELSITGSSHRIYINEHLTLKNKLLFREAREKAKQNNYRFVWVKHGTILTRANETSPVIAIRSEQDLFKINICA